MKTQKFTRNGIRFIACGYADFAWDEEKGWVSINSDYVRGGDRNPCGIRWKGCECRRDDWNLIEPHQSWLREVKYLETLNKKGKKKTVNGAIDDGVQCEEVWINEEIENAS